MMPTGAMCLAYFLHAFCLKKHYLPLFDEDDDETNAVDHSLDYFLLTQPLV